MTPARLDQQQRAIVCRHYWALSERGNPERAYDWGFAAGMADAIVTIWGAQEGWRLVGIARRILRRFGPWRPGSICQRQRIASRTVQQAALL